MSAVEAGGYGIVIAAALAVALGAVWFSFKELIFEPKEQTVFNRALDKIAVDPRVTVRVGTPMTGYGREGGAGAPGSTCRTPRTWTRGDAST